MWLPLLANFNNVATLSWGSACLAWFYRELCRASHAVSEQLSGAYFILQIWAWEHFPIISRTPVDHVSWDDDEYIALSYGLRYVLYMKSDARDLIHNNQGRIPRGLSQKLVLTRFMDGLFI
ncbi:Serine/threonine-protein phosphatase 7 long form homolog [Linum perenne]